MKLKDENARLRAEVEELKKEIADRHEAEQVALLELSATYDEVQRLTALLREAQTYTPKQSIKSDD